MAIAALLCIVFTNGAVADVTWQFDHREEVQSFRNIDQGKIAAGLFAGRTAWDPYLFFALPDGELDAGTLHYLTVRMYSSAKADVLDVYYKCADGTWGLGATLPIQPGWCVYRVDLRTAGWHESSAPNAGRQWGGATKRIQSFRIDPGNQAGRWIVIDSVRLTAKPTGVLGARREAAGQATDRDLIVTRRRVAGQPIEVRLTLSAAPPRGLQHGTALVRLMRGASVARLAVEPVELAAGKVTVAHTFPTSQYAFGGEYVACASILELEDDGRLEEPVRVINPRVGAMRSPMTKVADYRGDPALFLDGRPIPLITCVQHGGRTGELHRQMADRGVKIYTDWFGASTAGGVGWTAPGEYDFSAYDQYFVTVLDQVPDALFLPHVGIVAPRWWQQEHVEECCLFSNGARGPSSMASAMWKRDMALYLRKLITHLRRAPYADHIIGYIFYAGYTAEWQNWSTWRDYGGDYSRPAVTAYRTWLAREYGTVESLRRAWGDSAVTFATAAPAPWDKRWGDGPLLRDPRRERPVIDFDRFMSDMVADAINGFARVIKNEVGGSQVAGTYYGYMAAHGARQQKCGHNALSKVLGCPEIDFLMSPPMYANRQKGGTSTFMSATASVRLHGKLWLDESDLRTYTSPPASGYGRTGTAQDSVGAHWREFANVMTRRAGVSWFDMSGGWFSGRPMLEMFARQMKIAPDMFARRARCVADVALFIDADGVPYYRPSDLLRRMITNTIAEMPRVGVTWDLYLLSDAAASDLPRHKLYAVLNAARMPEGTRQALLDRAARDGATVLFLHAPGSVDERAIQTDGIARATGMSVSRVAAGAGQYRLLETTTKNSLGGPAASLDPRFAITDPKAVPLARWSDGAGVAMARKIVNGVPVVYCASVSMPPELWRNVARSAGAFVYCDTGDSVYADQQYIGLHATTDGHKVVHLPGQRRVTDMVTGKLLADNTDRIEQSMKMGQTLLLRLDTVK